MITFDLTASEAAVFANAVPGEPVYTITAAESPRGKHRRPPTLSLEQSGESECEDCSNESVPPARFVALTQPCPGMCGDIGESCDWCRGGRHVATLRKPCEPCGGAGILEPEFIGTRVVRCSCGRSRWWGIGPCSRCGAPGPACCPADCVNGFVALPGLWSATLHPQDDGTYRVEWTPHQETP